MTDIDNSRTFMAQPVHPAAEYSQFLSDVMTAAGLVTLQRSRKQLEFRDVADDRDEVTRKREDSFIDATIGMLNGRR